MLKNVPKDTLGEWSCREGASVCPSSVELKQCDKLGEIQWWTLVTVLGLGFFKHLSHVSVMEIRTSVKTEWEIIWNSLEQEAQNTMAKLGLIFASWLKSVDNMHLKVHELSIDRVLRWCVEMVLETVQVAALNLLLEQVNGRGPHEIVHW